MQAPDDFDPPIGTAQMLEPALRRIVAPNPSPMTYRGTNTYLLGTRGLAVIDPGPQSAPHLEAILDAVQDGQHISHIIVTHSHLDHAPLARPLAHAHPTARHRSADAAKLLHPRTAVGTRYGHNHRAAPVMFALDVTHVNCLG